MQVSSHSPPLLTPTSFRWVHLNTFCEWEWLSHSAGNTKTGCNMENVDFHGQYSEFECGLSFQVEPRHRGVWICELEKYHVGFDKRFVASCSDQHSLYWLLCCVADMAR